MKIEFFLVWRWSRNFLSHRVDLMPEPSESLIMLGGAFKLARILLPLNYV